MKKLTTLLIILALALFAVIGCTASAERDTNPVTPSPLNCISEDEALEAALTHAKVTEAQAGKVKTEFENDDGRPVYDIEFTWDNTENKVVIEYDYKIDAVTAEVISFDQEAKGYSALKDTAEGAADSGHISLDEAKAIALKHAGVNEENVKILKAELGKDDGIAEYEVEFIAGNVEYDYEIDASTGKVLSTDKDAETKYTVSSSDNTASSSYDKSSSSSGSPESPSLITKNKAKSIALKHAGVSSKNASFTKVILDKDDMEYDIEFTAGGVEYDYEINAATGKIESASKEAAPSPTVSQTISKAKAQSTALSHAGLSSGDVTGLKVTLDEDDGKYKYEVEFKNGRTEYEYEIDAATGKIIDWSKDVDD